MPADDSKPQDAVDAIDLLMQDHRTVESLFEEFSATDDKRKQRRIAHRICAELHVHAQIEEKILYPEAKAEVDEATGMINEGIVEHEAIKRLVREIPRLSATDEFFEPKLKVLKEFVEHHVKEEESETFPKLRDSGLDLRDVGERLAERKRRLAARAGLD
ncbi:MAG: hemerythrin domain-containing protein [Sinimarinibacterium flocculans]|uniref:hemerythrin domain-containing protein n=1 Tax=Sinimarinibacterium flocculans TaxID=985250 RepID=UPI002EA1DB6B|nr:hemerythrin domain-containing protein [Pseudomonadota bacterium]